MGKIAGDTDVERAIWSVRHDVDPAAPHVDQSCRGWSRAARHDHAGELRCPPAVTPGLGPIGVRLRRLEQRPCSIRTPFVMPGLGPGIHEFRWRRRGDRRRKSDPVSPDKPFPLQLVDARAKPWHDGGEVARAGWRLSNGAGRLPSAYARNPPGSRPHFDKME